MLVNVHQDLVRAASPVAVPNMGLVKLDPVEGLLGQTGTAVPQGFGVTVGAAQGNHRTRLTLDVGWGAVVAGGESTRTRTRSPD